MLRIALALTTLAISLATSLLIIASASGCGGEDDSVATTPTNISSDASASDEQDATSNTDPQQHADTDTDANTDADTAVDSSDAGADADAGDEMAFDTFMVGDQGAVVTAGTIDGTASTGYRIVQGTGGFFCGGAGVSGQWSFEFTIAVAAASPPAPGKYPITNGKGSAMRSEATFQYVDNQCHVVTSHAAQSGSITITSVDATTVKGMFDISFDGLANGGRAIGGFIAPLCNASLWAPHANCGP